MTIFVFANGDIEDIEWVRPLLPAASYVIAADGGARHLWRMGCLPAVVIGDGDSLTADVSLWLRENAVEMIVHPAEKDETDLELALHYADQIASPEQEIWVFGAFGGRFDQTMANVLLLVKFGRKITLVHHHQRATLIRNKTTIQGQIGDTLSLIPLNGSATVDTTTGLQWNLHNSTLEFGPARGVSNRLIAPTATIHLKTGILLSVHIDHTWQR